APQRHDAQPVLGELRETLRVAVEQERLERFLEAGALLLAGAAPVRPENQSRNVVHVDVREQFLAHDLLRDLGILPYLVPLAIQRGKYRLRAFLHKRRGVVHVAGDGLDGENCSAEQHGVAKQFHSSPPDAESNRYLLIRFSRTTADCVNSISSPCFRLSVSAPGWMPMYFSPSRPEVSMAALESNGIWS